MLHGPLKIATRQFGLETEGIAVAPKIPKQLARASAKIVYAFALHGGRSALPVGPAVGGCPAARPCGVQRS